MKYLKTRFPLLTLTLLFLAVVLSACGGSSEPSGTEQAAGRPSGEAVQAEHTGDAQVIEIAVDRNGYSPSTINLEQGVPARLIFTRTEEGGCTDQVQIPAFDIEQTDLPLNTPVAVEFTPNEAGEFTFICGMNMVEGTLLVQS